MYETEAAAKNNNDMALPLPSTHPLSPLPIILKIFKLKFYCGNNTAMIRQYEYYGPGPH